MSTSTLAITPSASAHFPSAFWERLWRSSGMQFVVFFIITYVIYGYQPGVGASTDAMTAFYTGNRTRILIAAVFSGLNILNLMWFAAALRTTLADADQDGWGAAAIASSAAFAGLCFLLKSVSAALAYSIARSANNTFISSLNDFSWSLAVLTSFPRAMLCHGSGIRAVAGKADLDRGLCGGGRSRRPHLTGRHDLDEKWILGAGWKLFAIRLAHHRSPVGRDRKPRPLDQKSCDASWMVTPRALQRSRLYLPRNGP